MRDELGLSVVLGEATTHGAALSMPINRFDPGHSVIRAK